MSTAPKLKGWKTREDFNTEPPGTSPKPTLSGWNDEWNTPRRQDAEQTRQTATVTVPALSTARRLMGQDIVGQTGAYLQNARARQERDREMRANTVRRLSGQDIVQNTVRRYGLEDNSSTDRLKALEQQLQGNSRAKWSEATDTTAGDDASRANAWKEHEDAEKRLKAVRNELERRGEGGYSLATGIDAILNKGLSHAGLGNTQALALAEKLLMSPFDLLSGQPFGTAAETGMFNELAREGAKGVAEADAYYAQNTAKGGKAARIFDELGTATVQALPNALLAMMSGGGSAAAQTTAGLTQTASAAAAPSVSAAVANSLSGMAKNPMYWTSFAQSAGPGYEQAIADGATPEQAALYAIGNGLMNAAVEIGGGVETLPAELQQGGSAWRAWVDSMLDEGKEEIIQGVIERASQNIAYRKGNPLFSVSDEDAIFNPVTSGKEFLGGAVVGGILGGGQVGVNAALNAILRSGAEVTNSVAEAILADPQAVAELGVTITEDMTKAQQRAAVKEAVAALREAPSEPQIQTPEQESAVTPERAEPPAVEPLTAPERTPEIIARDAQAVRTHAESMDPAGKKVFTELYNEDQDAAGYIREMQKWYNIGKNSPGHVDNVHANSNIINDYQARAAFFAGQTDGKNKSAPAVGAENRLLTEDDLGEYLKVGDRQHVRDRKTGQLRQGQSPILTTLGQIKSFIRSAISGETRDAIKAYGRVGSRMANDVKENIGVNVTGYYLELDSNRVAHLSDHAQEDGDVRNIPLTDDQVENLTSYIDNYSDILDALKRKDGSVRFTIGTWTNDGYVVVLELVSKGRQSIQPVSAWRNTEEHYEKKYGKKRTQAIDTSHPQNEGNSGYKPLAYEPTIPLQSGEAGTDQPQRFRRADTGTNLPQGATGKGPSKEASSGTTIRYEASNVKSQNRPGPESSVGADYYGENTVGAAQARFEYKEAPTQSVGNDIFTPEEGEAHPELVNPTHKVYSNAESRADAMERLTFDYEGEKESLEGPEAWGAAETVMGYTILDDLVTAARESGGVENNLDDILRWKKVFDSKGTEQGQALQARRQFTAKPAYMVAEAAEALESDKARKLNPPKKAWILNEVMEQADAFNNIESGDTEALIALIERNSEIRRTTGLFSKKTAKQMDWALHEIVKRNPVTAEQFLRDVAVSQIRSISSDYMKSSILDGIKSVRVMGMLSKLSTVMRNLVSNNIFDPVEALSNNIVVPLDMLLSKITGNRTTTVEKSWLSKAKRSGSLDGLLRSYVQVGLDADVDGATSRYETRTGRAFKMTGNPLTRLLSTYAKYQGYALNTTDEFQKGGIRAEAQSGIDKLKAKGKLDQNAMNEWAQETALQRTFQNDSRGKRMADKARSVFNEISVKDKLGGSIGAGDILTPFTGVPGNLVAQVANYSPFGLANSLRQITMTVIDAKRGGYTAEQQAQAVRNAGRGITGTAALVGFAALAFKGLISVAGSDDPDKEALEKAQGRTGTQWNLSATMRAFKGESTEWRDGDNLMSIGFLDPFNAIMSAGAMIADAYMEDNDISLKDVGSASISSIIQALLDMPAMSSISDLVNNYKYSDKDTVSGKTVDALGKYGAGQLSSFFIPNFVRGIATGTDDTVRNTYTSTDYKKNALDYAKGGVPGLRKTLPASYDSLGRVKTNTGNNVQNFLNSNILPGQITKFKIEPIEEEIARVYDATQNTGVYPDKKTSRSITVNSEKVALNDEDFQAYSITRGQTSYQLLTNAIKDQTYKNLSDPEKAKVITEIYDYANQTAKASVSAYEPEKWVLKAEEAQKKYGIPLSTYIAVKNAAANVSPLTYKSGENAGESISGSRDLQIMEKVYKTPGLNDKQRGAMFEYLGVGKSVIHYNKARVTEVLGAMRQYGVSITGDKMDAAYNAGISAKELAKYTSTVGKYDTDSNGSYTITERGNSIVGSGMSRKDQLTMWKVYYPDWQDKADAVGLSFEQVADYKYITSSAGATKKDQKIAALVAAGYSAKDANALYSKLK